MSLFSLFSWKMNAKNLNRTAALLRCLFKICSYVLVMRASQKLYLPGTFYLLLQPWIFFMLLNIPIFRFCTSENIAVLVIALFTVVIIFVLCAHRLCFAVGEKKKKGKQWFAIFSVFFACLHRPKYFTSSYCWNAHKEVKLVLHIFASSQDKP